MSSGPLEGYKVVELGQGLPAAFAALQLADGGAAVIKVEPRGGDIARTMPPFWESGESALFVSVNRNKRSIELDITTPEGRNVLRSLIEDADVLIEDADLTREAGLDVETLVADRDQLVHCRISGFGPEGPLAGLPGAEIAAQLASEVTLSLGSLQNPPVRMGTDVASSYAGLYAAQGILAALWRRHRDGQGQRIEVSLFGSLLAMRATLWAALSNPDEWFGFHTDSYVKPADYGYQARDGTIMVVVGRMSDEQWSNLFRELGLDTALSDEEKQLLRTNGSINARYAHIAKPVWEKALVNFEVDDLLDIFYRNGGNAYRINDYPHVFAHPQTQHLDLLRQVEMQDGTVTVMRPPWQFSDTPVSVRLSPPALGQHTDEVLSQLGYDDEAIRVLRAAGTIG
ncbi:MAG TPA: CaiB/BaiF CoA-transferase family protein [Dehalococcoidia bacterium]|nr:CaiB/BaiF CoA-transferase family protein [Dehalococcoidia bacterium]